MNHELLKTYYERFFPVKKLCSWLQLSEYRELSFCLKNDIYVRHISVSGYEELYKRVVREVPEKIDVGPVYDTKPAKHVNKRAISKEIVFDIDLTDYSRNCCREKSICARCFPIIKVSVELLNHILTKELGFTSLGFVFSGRRGLHCWVNDLFTKNFNDFVRGNIVKYFDSVISKKEYRDQYTKIMRKYQYILVEQGFATGEDAISEDLLYEKLFLRLDKEVTSKMAHLIKLPFCVHPSTNILSVPIDVDCIDNLTLEGMPTLQLVMSDPNVMTKYIKTLDSWAK